jgi:hypothetical protein
MGSIFGREKTVKNNFGFRWSTNFWPFGLQFLAEKTAENNFGR